MEKSQSPDKVIPKVVQTQSKGTKSGVSEDEKASLVKPSQHPYIYRTVAKDEDEREKMMLKQKAMQMQRNAALTFKAAEAK